MTSPRSWVAPDGAGLGRLVPAAALAGGWGAMALRCLQRVELALFAAAFLCGAVAAAALTRTQVRLRDGTRVGVGTGRLGGLAARCALACDVRRLGPASESLPEPRERITGPDGA